MLAVAVAEAFAIIGCGSTTVVPNAATAAPAFSPATGTYTSAQTVTISDPTPGAAIYYTTNGGTPTISSTLYSGAITVSTTEVIEAIGVAPGDGVSAVATAAYTISGTVTNPPAATPTFSPAAGAYTLPQTVTLSDTTSGAAIYYTTNGSTPSTSSTVYSGAIAVSATETLKAIAAASGYTNSAVATATYTISQAAAATPVFSLATGTYTSAQTMTIGDQTAGATIYYTTNGSTPSASSTLYSGAITVSATQTVEAIAVASGYANSAVAMATYTISQPAAATPVLSLATGTYTGTQTVSISDTTPGAAVYYAINGIPSASSTLYSGAITVSATQTIEAIAVASGYSNSAIATATYTISQSTVTAIPVISPFGGAYTSIQSVTIGDPTSGATIYYTTDGSTPSTSSTLYSGAITVSATETIEAIAVAPGLTTSGVASAAYTITGTTTLSGAIFGGTQAVTGVQVQLYEAGHSGYGTGATALIASAPTTNGNGAFTMIFDCPAAPVAPDDQVYLVATGGSAGGGANPALALMAALGSCNNLGSSPQVTVNEVTTAAAVYALAPFMSAHFATAGAESIGTSSTNLIGLENAFATASNLANVSTGTSPGAAAPLGVIIPSALIDSLANSLASCVSSNGTACTGGLFAAVTPTGATPPSDTIQAALYVAQNPADNVAAIFNLAPSPAPFAGLSAAPNDWTAEIAFNGVTSSGNAGEFNTPFLVAIDAGGNAWIIDNPMTLGGSPVSATNPANFVSVLSNDGTVLSGASGYANTSNATSSDFTYPRGLAIDLNGNAWIANDSTIAARASTGPADSNLIFEISPSGAVSSIQTGTTAGTALEGPYAVAIDSLNNVWFTSTTLKKVGKIGNGDLSVTLPATGTNTTGATPSGIAVDTNGNIWVTGTATAAAGGGVSYIVNPLNGLSGAGASTLFSASPINTPYGVAIDANNNAWIGNESTPAVVLNMNSSGTVLQQCSGGDLTTPRYLAVDGAGNVWVTNLKAAPAGYMVEFSSTCQVLSGSTGFGGGTGSLISDPRSVAIDSSGNVWVANNVTGTSASTTVVEIVGAAAPTVTPLALALKNNKVGQRP
jgi:hypothetical protein